MSSPQTLLFDLDGCLVDSLPSIARCWAETLPEFGLPVPPMDVLRAHVGPPVHESARAYAPDADETLVARIVAAYRARSAAATDVQPFPGIAELLSMLSDRGAVLGIATSKSIEVVDPLLDRLDWRRFFRVVEGTRVDELGTDKTTIIARAMEGLAPLHPTIHTGDREHDIIGAHDHGLIAVGALWGYGSRAELTAAGADVIVTTPAELAGYLEAQPAPAG